MPRTIPLSYI
ncbi:hypothetical protein GQ607_013933 [Colletotrichum asianum]|uniref:Uncharacterized protein n=1 Tax=Colletotrichum asianum TaxID=702518 RepID=A0A8H3W436_9PEZI|nr:hypothetical protein GQ607_013933 [Colletotrichum asianum]